MVIRETGVLRDPPSLLARMSVVTNGGFPGWGVAGRQSDNGTSARQYELRRHAFARVSLEVLHFAVLALSDPLLELFRMRRRFRARESASVEPQRQRLLPNFFFHRTVALLRARLN